MGDKSREQRADFGVAHGARSLAASTALGHNRAQRKMLACVRTCRANRRAFWTLRKVFVIVTMAAGYASKATNQERRKSLLPTADEFFGGTPLYGCAEVGRRDRPLASDAVETHVQDNLPREPEKEDSVMSARSQFRGICSTCKRAASCVYVKDRDRPVLECCEHEGFEPHPTPIQRNRSAPPVVTRGKRDVQEDNSAEYTGLCRHCANRETCTFPKPDGGVWHCDEYE